MFLSEYEYSVSATSETPLKELFNEYRNYCNESGFKACSLRTLADRLRNAGFETERKSFGTSVFAAKKSFF
jgi:putative DNA primase/helicase